MSVFKIVFEGNVAPKRRLVEVKYALSQLYKVEVSKIEHLFNGELHVLKENLTEVEADRYVEALESTGIVVKKADSATFAELMKPKPVVIKPKPIIQKPVVNAIQSPSVPLQPLRRVSDSDQDNNYSDYEHAEVSFFSPSGRIGRMRYFSWYIGLSFLLLLVVALIDLPGFIVSIIQAVFGFIFAAQRLHDLNRSAWWFLFLVMACIGIMVAASTALWGLTVLLLIFVLVFSLYVALWPGTQGENAYGASPSKNSLGVKIIFWLYISFIVCGLIAVLTVPRFSDYVREYSQKYVPQSEDLGAVFMKQCSLSMEKISQPKEICGCVLNKINEQHGSITNLKKADKKYQKSEFNKFSYSCIDEYK